MAGIEVMHAMRQGQLETNRSVSQTAAGQFSAVAASIPYRDISLVQS
jgi:hypothetical protein